MTLDKTRRALTTADGENALFQQKRGDGIKEDNVLFHRHGSCLERGFVGAAESIVFCPSQEDENRATDKKKPHATSGCVFVVSVARAAQWIPSELRAVLHQRGRRREGHGFGSRKVGRITRRAGEGETFIGCARRGVNGAC